jgi:hypothetical protein
VKIAATVARYLLGLIFLVFGSNMLFHFIPTPPIPPGPLADFTRAFAVSHYDWAIGFFQIAPAILLLANRYVPLASPWLPLSAFSGFWSSSACDPISPESLNPPRSTD